MIDPCKPNYGNSPVSTVRAKFFYRPQEASEPPLISIVTPVWNSREFLEETKACVFQQSLQRFEWIIIDDGSDEACTLSQIREYEREDPRVRAIYLSENRGPSVARNAGIKESRSEFVLFLDSDNLIEPTTAEKMYWFLHSFPWYSFVTGFCVGFGDQQYLWERGFHSREAFLRNNQADITSLVRREVLMAVNGFDETIRAGCEDWDLWLRCADRGFWGATIPEFLIWYRRRVDHSDRWPDWDEGPRQAAFRATLRRHYPGLWSEGFPRPGRAQSSEPSVGRRNICPRNLLVKSSPRCLVLLPVLKNGKHTMLVCSLLRSLQESKIQATIAVNHLVDQEALARLTHCTPDIFVLSHFLSFECCPTFMRYIATSRGVDLVINMDCDSLRNHLSARDGPASRPSEIQILNLRPLASKEQSSRWSAEALGKIGQAMACARDSSPNTCESVNGLAAKSGVAGWTPEHLDSPVSASRRIQALAYRLIRDKLGISIGTRRFV